MTKKNASQFILGGIFCFLLTGCASVGSSFDPRLGADIRAEQNGFQKNIIQTSGFSLLSYSKIKNPGQPVRIYIEGDGQAWLSKRVLSQDPTPKSNFVFKLASQDAKENVVYLARPCQYGPFTEGRNCGPDYWSSKRFSEEVVASSNEAVDRIKREANAVSVELIGYSGGGAIAVLVASRRNDVTLIRTIAGNLDHKAWTEFHHDTPLTGSLNAIDAARNISNIPQEHYVGSDDKVIPLFIAKSFAKASGDPPNIKVIVIDGATHNSGWKKFEN